MPPVPSLSPRRVLKALREIGYELDRVNGSHHLMKRSGSTISVPVHNRDVPKGTLRSIINATGLSVEEFIKLT